MSRLPRPFPVSVLMLAALCLPPAGHGMPAEAPVGAGELFPQAPEEAEAPRGEEREPPRGDGTSQGEQAPPEEVGAEEEESPVGERPVDEAFPETLRGVPGEEAVSGREPVLDLDPGEEPPPERPEEWGRERLVDRIVAVVDLDPVLQSEVEQVIQLGLAERRPDESPEEFRLRVLQDLIDQRLRYQEVGRLGPGVAVEAIEAEIEQIRAAYPSQEAFREDLERSGTTMDELRQIIARQLAVVEYVNQRLGPRIFVSLDEIREFYRQELEPALRGRGVEPPALEAVREDIRELLKQRHLNEEIQRWTEELRRQADIQILVDLYPDQLPPVIHRIGPEGGGGP